MQAVQVGNASSAGFMVFLGNGDGTFDLANLVTMPTASQFLVAGDFNDDGKLDLALAYSCGGGGGNHGESGTPAGTYTLTVTGTFNSGSTSLSGTAKLSLVVQ